MNNEDEHRKKTLKWCTPRIKAGNITHKKKISPGINFIDENGKEEISIVRQRYF